MSGSLSLASCYICSPAVPTCYCKQTKNVGETSCRTQVSTLRAGCRHAAQLRDEIVAGRTTMLFQHTVVFTGSTERRLTRVHNTINSTSNLQLAMRQTMHHPIFRAPFKYNIARMSPDSLMIKYAGSRISTGSLMGKSLGFSVAHTSLIFLGFTTMHVLFALTFYIPIAEERPHYFIRHRPGLHKHKTFFSPGNNLYGGVD